MTEPQVPARPRHGLVRGLVPLEGRGDLPFATLHGRPLLQHAVDALRLVCEVTVTADAAQAGEARAALSSEVGLSSPEQFWQEHSTRVLLHDCLCPLAPADFLAAVAARDRQSAAYRPVTDTLKAVEGDVVGRTIDRERFGIVTSPVLLLDVTVQPPTEELGRLVAWMRQRGPVDLVPAPPEGRRAVDRVSVRLLESLDLVEHGPRTGPAGARRAGGPPGR